LRGFWVKIIEIAKEERIHFLDDKTIEKADFKLCGLLFWILVKEVEQRKGRKD